MYTYIYIYTHNNIYIYIHIDIISLTMERIFVADICCRFVVVSLLHGFVIREALKALEAEPGQPALPEAVRRRFFNTMDFESTNVIYVTLLQASNPIK